MHNKCKLLFVDNSIDTFYSYRLPLAEAARQAGFEIHVAAPTGRCASIITAKGFTFHPVHMSRSGIKLFQELGTVAELYRLYRRIQPDLVHHLRLKPVLYGGLAAFLARTPAEVSMPTGLGHVFISKSFKARCLRKFTLLGCRLAFLHRNLRVVFQNPDDRQIFIEANALDKRKSVLIKGSGVDISDFRPTEEPVGRPVIILAARMLKDKGIIEFVEAARLLKGHASKPKFVLVGDTDVENPTAVPIAQLQEWQDSGLVEWWGYRDDMRRVMAAATIICLPSYREGVPKVLIEAASSGRAIVATDVPGCREIVRHGQNGLLVPPRNSRLLACAIQLLIEQPKLRADMARRGRHIAVAEFSIDRVITETIEVYHSVLSTSERRKQGSLGAIGKRAIDIVGSTVGLIVAAPLWAAVATAIRLTSPGPVLYKGTRVGLNGESFRIWKFRTMVINAERLGGSATAKDDPRITPIGAFLRRYKLDELPQLVNVLTGQMSLVGPRPEVRKYVDRYTQEERQILTCTPGITDWASIWNSNEGDVLEGSPDPEKAYEELIRPTKLALQRKYVNERSLIVDFRILLATALKLLRPGWIPKELKAYPPVRSYRSTSRANTMNPTNTHDNQERTTTDRESPALPQRLRFIVPTLPPLESVIAEYTPAYKHGLITNANCVARFESSVAEYLGVKECVAVSSCTSGLTLVMRALGLSGEVIVPSFTFFATAHAMRWNGLTPVFADCEVDTWNVDPEDVEKKITSRTSAILAVHMYGNPCNVERLAAIAARHGLKLLFDAAHAFGSRVNGRPIGQFGDAEVFSLSPTKVLVAGEGGLITTNDSALARTLRVMRNYGDNGSYDPEYLGANARMTEFNAALAINGLPEVENKVARRNDIARQYTSGLSSLPGLRFQKTRAEDIHTYKDYSIHITPDEFGLSRDELGMALLNENIETKRYFYPPLHDQKLYRQFIKEQLPNTSYVSNHVLSLPIYESLPDDTIAKIVNSIINVHQQCKVSNQNGSAKEKYYAAV